MQLCFRIFVLLENTPQKSRIFSIVKNTNVQPRTASRQNPPADFLDNQRNVVRLPDNHDRLLQKTKEPASHPPHINAYQVANVREYCLQFCILRGMYL